MEEELTAEALVAKAGPGADPLPNVVWRAFNANGRCLEDLPESSIQALKLEAQAMGTEVKVHVVLVFSPNQPCSKDYGSLEVLYEAQLTQQSKVRWPLRVAHGRQMKLYTWVKNKGLRLTGQYKAHMPGQGGPRLLVLEVQPLEQAAAPTCQTTGCQRVGRWSLV